MIIYYNIKKEDIKKFTTRFIFFTTGSKINF